MEHRKYEDRDRYQTRQIAASTSKLTYCKFSYRDAENYVRILSRHQAVHREQTDLGPVLCLGVRHGREVDLFRIALYGSPLRRQAVKGLERRWHGMNSRLPALERFGRTNCDEVGAQSCIGVELNPLAKRSDVWVGSYDALPPQWASTFGVVFSNAFDHAFEPYSTAAEWCRVLRPGGYLVLQYPEQQGSDPIGPVGLVTLEDVRELFPGEVVYFRHRGSTWNYTEYVIRLG